MIDPAYRDMLAEVAAPGTKTRRGKDDIVYRSAAIRVLADDPRFVWLCDGPGASAGTGKPFRFTILTELGRLKDPDLIREAALAVCEAKPRAKDAARWLRDWRLGTKRGRDERIDAIVRAVVNAVTSLPFRPSNLAEVHDALDMAAGHFATVFRDSASDKTGTRPRRKG